MYCPPSILMISPVMCREASEHRNDVRCATSSGVAKRPTTVSFMALTMSFVAGGRRVVVTGLGAVTPLGNDVPTYWRRLVAGESGITVDETSVDDEPANLGNPWPAGTTADWRENSSMAPLDLPVESDVLYAEQREFPERTTVAQRRENRLAGIRDRGNIIRPGDQTRIPPDADDCLGIL